jgi:hypothetical protein
VEDLEFELSSEKEFAFVRVPNGGLHYESEFNSKKTWVKGVHVRFVVRAADAREQRRKKIGKFLAFLGLEI